MDERIQMMTKRSFRGANWFCWGMLLLVFVSAGWANTGPYTDLEIQARLTEGLSGNLVFNTTDSFALDVNRDGVLDVADLVFQINAINQFDDAHSAYTWLTPEGGLKDLQSTYDEIRESSPTLLDELAVFVCAYREVYGATHYQDLYNDITGDWPENWSTENQQELITACAQLGDVSSVMNLLDDLSPASFAAIMCSRFGLSGELPENLYLNTNLQQFQIMLAQSLLPYTSWHEAWLLGTVQRYLPWGDTSDPWAEHVRQVVVAAWAFNSFTGSGQITRTGREIVNLLVDGQGPNGYDLVLDSVRVGPYRVNPRSLLALVLKTNYLAEHDPTAHPDIVEDIVTGLALDDESIEDLVLGQIDLLLLYRALADLKYSVDPNTDFRGVSEELLGLLPSQELENSYLAILGDLYDAAADTVTATDTLLTSPVADDMALQVLLTSFRYFLTADRTAFSYSKRQRLLFDPAVGLAQLYVRAFGNYLAIPDDVPVPGIDDIAELRGNQFNSPDDWANWSDGFSPYKMTTNIYKLICNRDLPAGLTAAEQVDLQAPFVLNHSRLGEGELALSPGLRRLLQLTTALYLNEQAAAIHRTYLGSIASVMNPSRSKPGMPPLVTNDVEFLEEVVRRYLLAGELLRQAWPQSGWEQSEDCLSLGPIYSWAELEANRLFSTNRRALFCAVNNVDFWGLGNRPFSFLGLERQADILERLCTLLLNAKVDDIDRQEFDINKNIYGAAVERQENIFRAKQHQTAAAENDVLAAEVELQEASSNYLLQDKYIEVSEYGLEEVGFLKDAREFYNLKDSTLEEAEDLKKEIVDRNVKQLTKQLEFLEENVKDARKKMNRANSNLKLAKAIPDQLAEQYKQARAKAVLEAPCEIPGGGYWERCIRYRYRNEYNAEVRAESHHGTLVVWNYPKKDCEKYGGIKHLGKEYSDIIAEINAKWDAQQCNKPGILGDLQCSFGDFWEQHKEVIIAAGDLVAMAYTGHPLASYVVAAVDLGEGLISGNQEKTMAGVTRGLGALMKDPSVTNYVNSSLSGTAVGDFMKDKGGFQAFANKSLETAKFIESGGLKDPARMKQMVFQEVKSLADEYGITRDLDQLATDLVREEIAKPLRELGTSYLTNKAEFADFLKEQVGYNDWNSEIQNAVNQAVNSAQDKINEQITADPDLAWLKDQIEFADKKIDELIDGEGTIPLTAYLEDQIVARAIEEGLNNAQIKKALVAVDDIYQRISSEDGIIREIENLPNFPKQYKGKIKELLVAYGEARQAQIERRNQNTGVVDIQNAVRCVDTKLLVDFLHEVEALGPVVEYLKKQPQQVELMQKIVVLPDKPENPQEGRSYYEDERDLYISQVQEIVVDLQNRTVAANDMLSQIETQLAQKKAELEGALGEQAVQEALVAAAQYTTQASMAEVRAAGARLLAASTEVEIARWRKDILEMTCERLGHKLQKAREELLAARMYQEAAVNDLAIAALEQDRHEILANTLSNVPRYWNLRAKEQSYRVARMAFLDYIRTLDHVNGSNLLEHFKDRIDISNAATLRRWLENVEAAMLDYTVNNQLRYVGDSDEDDPVLVAGFDLTSAQLGESFRVPVFTLDLSEGNVLFRPNETNLHSKSHIRIWQVEVCGQPSGEYTGNHPGDAGGEHVFYPEDFFYGIPFSRRTNAEETVARRLTFDRVSIQSKPGSSSDQEYFKMFLLHLGDAWYPYVGNPDLVLNYQAVPPMLYANNPDAGLVGWGLPPISQFLEFFTNHNYWVEIEMHTNNQPGGGSQSADNFFGCHYPIHGTWWVMCYEEDLPEGDWAYRFELRGKGIITDKTTPYENYIMDGELP